MNTGSYFGYIGMGAVPERHRRRPRHASPRSSASSPPSRSRRCCSTSTASRSARAASIRRSPPGDLHRRMVAGRSRRRRRPTPGRPGRRRHHLPRRRARRSWSRRPSGRGVFVLRLSRQPEKLAPEGYLTGAEWNWAKVYKTFVEKAQKGEPLPNFVRGGLAEGFVKMSPYGPAVPEAARKQADAVKAEIMKGGYSVIKGPLKDNKGNDGRRRGHGLSGDRHRARIDELPGRRRDRRDWRRHDGCCPASWVRRVGVDASRSTAAAGADRWYRLRRALEAVLVAVDRARAGGGGVLAVPAVFLGKSPVDFFALIWRGALRQLVLAAEHAVARGAAAPHGAVRRAARAARPRRHRRRGRGGAGRARGRGRRAAARGAARLPIVQLAMALAGDGWSAAPGSARRAGCATTAASTRPSPACCSPTSPSP